MTFTLLRTDPRTRPRRPKAHRAAPALEGLEVRTVMSHAALPAVAAHVAAHVSAQAAPAAAPHLSLPLNVTGINLTKLVTNAAGMVTGVTGTLTGTLLGQNFSTPVTLTQTAAPGSTVPVLHLALAPIHLNLLGLHVDTSPICLDITAHTGPGNLLGNLVGSVANLLNGTTPGSTTGLLGTLNGLLTKTAATGTGAVGSILGVANGALNQGLLHLGNPSLTGLAPGATPVLNLSVGPLDLNVLGLEVKLDNCSNGPVTVAITAVPGSGNLLGNLLSGLAGLLNGGGLGGILGGR